MKIHLLLLIILVFVSCEVNDKFSGSPVNNLEIQTIIGSVSSTENYALAGQEIDFTASLPDNFRMIYNDTVSVEATTTTIVGSVRKSTIDILPNQKSATGKIFVGGGLGNLFDSSFKLSLTAMKLKKELAGKHFLLNSNIITIGSGNTTIPADDAKKLAVQLTWLNKVTQSQIQLRTVRENSVAITFSRSSSSGSANIRINNTNYLSTFNTNLSTTIANFVSLHASTLAGQGITLEPFEYSLVINFPSPTFANVTITRVAPILVTTLTGRIYKEALFNPSGNQVKDFGIYNEQKVNASGNLVAEGDFDSYNPGTYIFSIGINNAAQLEAASATELKYRLVLKFPDNKVQILNGVYNNLVPTINNDFKPVLKVKKTGIGSSSSYIITNINP